MEWRRLMAMSHHRHTGKYLAHHHTSWAGLTLILILSGMLLAALTLSEILPINAASGTMEVSAVVSGPPPTTAPTLRGPGSGAHVNAADLSLSGQCEAGLVVAISSNSIRKGSILCDASGHYSIHVTLVEGQNDLVATQYDTLDQPSPPSPVLTIYFDTLPQQNITSTRQASSRSISGNAPIVPFPSKPLTIATGNHFQGTLAQSDFRLTGSIRGGTAPYAINIDWGDRSSDLISLGTEGRFEASHSYDHGGDYAVIIKITDINGVTSSYQTVVSIIGPKEHSSDVNGGRIMIAWPIYISMALLVLGFWLGELYDRQRHNPNASPV